MAKTSESVRFVPLGGSAEPCERDMDVVARVRDAAGMCLERWKNRVLTRQKGISFSGARLA